MSRIGGSLSNLTAIESTDSVKKNPTKTHKISHKKPITFTIGGYCFWYLLYSWIFPNKSTPLVIN